LSTSGPNTIPKPPIKRHDTFFIRSVYFKAKDTLFSVPHYGRPCSATEFENKFNPSRLQGGCPGLSEDNPIVLDDDVTEFNFASLLKAMYPLPGSPGSPDNAIPSLTVDEWLSVLRLCKKYQFPKMKTRAFLEVDVLIMNRSPIEKIELSREYDEVEWLRDAYIGIASRTDMITMDEKSKLDAEAYVGLLELRDRAWTWMEKNRVNNYARRDHQKINFDYNTALKEIFGDKVKMTS